MLNFFKVLNSIPVYTNDSQSSWIWIVLAVIAVSALISIMVFKNKK